MMLQALELRCASIPGRIVNASPARRMARPGSFEEVPVRPPDDAPMEINGAGRVGQSFRSSPEDTCPKVLHRGPSVPQTYVYIYIDFFMLLCKCTR